MKLEGYSDYEIYPETGQVWSYKRGRYIKNKKGRGYFGCSLTDDNGTIIHWLLHRLIWTAINGEIPDGVQVNHIDENKSNNSISNLNLMTPKENTNWGTGIQRSSEKRCRNGSGFQYQIFFAIKEGGIKYVFKNLTEAKNKGFQPKEIVKNLKGIFKQHKGFKWQYAEDYLADWWDKEMDKYMGIEKDCN